MANDRDANLPSDIYSNRSWVQKFRISFRGLWLGLTGTQSPNSLNSFGVHVPIAIVVVLTGVWIGLEPIRLSLLLLCIGTVMAAELFNSSLESLAKAITDQTDQNVANALDIASGAVLLVSLTASIVGALILGIPILQMWTP
ncbi:diacylglycerol kinase [bacterium]|jgi:diacylglycerol kinase (ATP)|nr:diacylglycerol kinase [Mariniblastus sp.]MDB4460118.1 diacylglycerol kinase [bacterium]MDA7880454.1 diacylglycerol kinase [Mariniblastus sp.]MDA7906094.1 diacylglycerol kinase [Mariniblastus sp.]MDA7925813.1 diacylglycerol kinase [Mariniblastus sp.]